MQITFYTFNKRSNSTKRPSGAGFGVDVVLKDGVSIYTPSFVLKDYDPAYNYVKWDNRYYFIRDVVFERQNVYTVSCVLDALRTYKEAILSTSALVKYSASDYNINISDHRLRSNPNATYASSNAAIISNATTTGASGTYILQYVTSNPTFGMSGVVWCDYRKAIQVAGALVNSSFLDGADMVKEFGNAYNAVIGCRYVPFQWTPAATTKEIYLGSYMSGIYAGVPLSKAQETTVNVTIPWQYSDFRNNREYTSLLMFLPGYGVIDIAPEDVRGKSSIPVTLTVDGITGEGTYIVGDFFRATVNFSIPMSVGTISGNNVRRLTGIVNAGLSLASGNMFGAISSATGSVMAAFQRNVGNVGNSGGLSPILATIGSDWRNVYLVSICHNTNVEPSTVTSTIGRPLNAVRQLSALSGYVQTDGISVQAANDEINDQINSMIDGGIYLE